MKELEKKRSGSGKKERIGEKKTLMRWQRKKWEMGGSRTRERKRKDLNK